MELGLLIAEKLKQVHYHLFKDDRFYCPGDFRMSSGEHVRTRNIESEGRSYLVVYHKNEVTAQAIQNVMDEFRVKVDSSGNEIAALLSDLYVGLDRIHPFEDGNSRTIRTFLWEVANHYGYILDWSKIASTQKQKDEFYKARDKAVLLKEYPNLTKESLASAGAIEFEVYASLRYLETAKDIKEIFEEIISQKERMQDPPEPEMVM